MAGTGTDGGTPSSRPCPARGPPGSVSVTQDQCGLGGRPGFPPLGSVLFLPGPGQLPAGAWGLVAGPSSCGLGGSQCSLRFTGKGLGWRLPPMLVQNQSSVSDMVLGWGWTPKAGSKVHGPLCAHSLPPWGRSLQPSAHAGSGCSGGTSTPAPAWLASPVPPHRPLRCRHCCPLTFKIVNQAPSSYDASQA